MKPTKSFLVFSILVLSIAFAFPQGRGARQGAQGAAGRGQGGGFGQGQGSEQGQIQSNPRAAEAQAEHKRVQSTKEQREQIRICDKSADAVRKQARDMAGNSGKNFNAKEAARQHSMLQNQIQNMEQEHERLMNGLNAIQQQAWKEQIRNMNQLREQLHEHLREMQAEQKANPDGTRNAERAREIEKIMNSWKDQYGVISSQAAY